jgi:hypothetical protein
MKGRLTGYRDHRQNTPQTRMRSDEKRVSRDAERPDGASSNADDEGNDNEKPDPARENGQLLVPRLSSRLLTRSPSPCRRRPPENLPSALLPSASSAFFPTATAEKGGRAPHTPKLAARKYS